MRFLSAVLCAVVALGVALDRCPAEAALSCTISINSGVAFGAYGVFSSSPTQATGSLTVNCSGSGPITVTLSRGSSSTFSPRTLVSGGNHLNYNLYVDGAHSTIWGDGTGGTSTVTGTMATPSPQSLSATIYGQITPQQDLPAGSYGDTVVATVNF